MAFVTIDRYHDISCGHRVVGHESKCRHLHGHNYRITFTAHARELDSLGRVVDFSVLKSQLCQWLEDNWDHKMLLWEEDPVGEWLMALPGYATHAEKHELENVAESVVILPTNPTAENMALHLLNVVGPQQLAGTGVSLIMVRVEETRKCAATVGTGLWTATEQE